MNRRQFLSSAVLSLAGVGVSARPQLAARFGTPLAMTLPLVPARMADSLCQSFLINTKMFYKDQVYGHTDAVISLLGPKGDSAGLPVSMS